MKKVEFNPLPHLKEKVGRRIVIACLATAAVIAAQPFLQDGTRKSTAQEAQIAAKLKDAFGKTRVVRCLQTGELPSRSNPFYRNANKLRAGVAWPYIPFIWLEQGMCDDLEAFAADPPQTNQELIEYGPFALHTLVHEYEHTTGIADEGDAECRALRDIGKLGESFGMSSSLGGDLAYHATTALMDRQLEYESNGQGHLIETYDISDCQLPDFGPDEPAFVVPSEAVSP